MVLSEAEAEAQLASLRRQRETLDRAIADLSLYLELGRRLTAEPPPVGEIGPIPAPPPPQPGSAPDRAEVQNRDAPGQLHRAGPEPLPDGSGRQPRDAGSSDAAWAAASDRPAADGPGENPLSEGVLSENVLARRHGRALIDAALAALAEAGRPLHAGEILAVLTARGFSLPGHDPIAALNTRLWKRSGPGGSFRRMGDAVYALPESEDTGRPDSARR